MITLPKIWKRSGRKLPSDQPQKIEKAQTIQSVAIFGSSDVAEDSKIFKETYNVAFALAQAGYTVIDGGGPGVMRAATLGAQAANGRVVGVTFYPKDIEEFRGRDPKNTVDKEIKTESYVERTLTLMKEGQVYVVFNGATGTLSEFAMAWGLARIYLGHHKPLILYGDFWKKIMDILKKTMLIRQEELLVYKIVNCPSGVLLAIKQFEEEIATGKYKHLIPSKEDGKRPL